MRLWQLLVFSLLFACHVTGCESAPEKPLATRPEKADPNDWCAEHAVPESMCTKCHPELVERYKAANDFCAGHGLPESVCPLCHPLDPPASEGGEARAGRPRPTDTESGAFAEGTVIKLKDADHAKVAGIEVTEARTTPVGLGIRAPAQVEFDRNAVADVRAPVSGIVREVLVDLGANVEAGADLFVLESAEVGDLQAGIRAAREELDAAKSNQARQERLASEGIASARKVEVARQQTQAAQARLQSLQSSLRLAGAAGSRGRFTVRSPIAGQIVRRPAVVGMSASSDTSLATVADASTMWAIVDVPETSAGMVELGQPVRLRVSGVDKMFEGKVTWISPEVDARTRAVSVRAEVENPDGKLRANQFAEAEIGIAPDESSVVIPADALQRLDDTSVVFVRTGDATFEPRAIEPGIRSGDLIQVRKGVKEGEPVVSTGAFLLKTELKRDAIGAGCCEVEE